MASRRHRQPKNMSHEGAGGIIKKLDRLGHGGWSSRDSFRDWMEVSKIALVRLPAHLEATVQGLPFPPDTVSQTAEFNRIRNKYGDKGMTILSECFAEILLHPDEDLPGAVFEEWVTHGHNGQYFTPWPICDLMSHLMIGNCVPELVAQVAAQYAGSRYGLMHSLITSPEHTLQWANDNPETALLSLEPEQVAQIQPFTVHDPACGSGRMLMSAAKQIPTWMLRYNLVQFYGQDIDYDCCLMAEVNLMLMGLNGWSLRAEVALSKLDVTKLSDAARRRIEDPSLPPEERDDILKDYRDSQLKQASLF